MFVERTIIVQDIDKLEVMTRANFVVVRVVSRSDADSACARLHVDVDDGVVCDDRNAPLDKRVGCISTVEVLRVLLNTRGRGCEWDQSTWYRGSSGWTAIAVSANIVSGCVVATTIFSSDPGLW
jgi:hypothetical protein